MSGKRGLVVATAAAVAAGCGASSSREATASAHYTLGATKRCLVAHGATVAPVRPVDSRLRQLHDLAQKNSIQAVSKVGRAGLAFTKSDSDAKLLVELLVVPKDTYRVVAKANAVLMVKKTQPKAYTLAVGCLRPKA